MQKNTMYSEFSQNQSFHPSIIREKLEKEVKNRNLFFFFLVESIIQGINAH